MADADAEGRYHHPWPLIPAEHMFRHQKGFGGRREYCNTSETGGQGVRSSGNISVPEQNPSLQSLPAQVFF